ncbi:MAG: hypothetical protein HY370_04445, partial [Proteobacteria bacterium]|nr:hypothetical protein [Pseudomonadota bacterium]
LITFNVFIALILSVTFLSRTGAGSASIPDRLTEPYVVRFIEEFAAITGGQRTDMDSYALADYFMDHLSKEIRFTTTLRYSIPDQPEEKRTLEMDRATFIGNVMQGQRTIDKHETKVRIEYIDIADDEKSATVLVTNYERGLMPVDDGAGNEVIMPVQGTSYCEQKLSLDENFLIRLDDAICTTDIVFSEGL